MYTNTPRDNEGQFKSWNHKVNEAASEAGSYNTPQDAALAVVIMAAGAAVWEFGKWVYEKVTE